jgi:predicted amidohydrolase YtcJ
MILLDNGRFYTPNQPNTTAILIDKGFIRALGRAGEDLSHKGNITHRFDLKGKIVWPGLTDAHIHLATYGLFLLIVDCETASLQECLEQVDKASTKTHPHNWILGHGWNQNTWSGGYGTAAQLDTVSHSHPVYLTAKSLHAAWSNTRAMELAGINAETPDPPGGQIIRDTAGNPSGIFIESAMKLITSVIPERTGQETEQAILKGVGALNQMGITSVHDFDPIDRLMHYWRLESAGQLNLRILKAIPPDDHHKALDAGLLSGKGDGLVQIGPYKYFMDGALGPHTAAMLEPYQDDPSNHGVLNLSSEDVVRLSKEILRNGSDLSIHAIGDRANQEAIKAFRVIRKNEVATGQQPVKLRIEHVQVISAQNLMDFYKFNITASMQPLHAISDMDMADTCWGERKQLAYAWKSLQENGARLVFGSDAPVESPDPFRGLHAAVTRQRPDDSPAPDGWVPNQRITLKSALEAYTIHPAGISRVKSISGTLEPGSPADLILLERDPFMAKAQELHHIHPMATMFNGQWVWVDQGTEL